VADIAYENNVINKEKYEEIKSEMKKNKVNNKERDGLSL